MASIAGHVVALILFVSIVGIGMEVNLFHAVFKWGSGSRRGEDGAIGGGGTVAAVAASISHLSSGGTRRKQASETSENSGRNFFPIHRAGSFKIGFFPPSLMFHFNI